MMSKNTAEQVQELSEDLGRICTCFRCGYVWERRVQQPKQCPKCKRTDYDRKTMSKIKGV
jgi:rubrerythrin